MGPREQSLPNDLIGSHVDDDRWFQLTAGWLVLAIYDMHREFENLLSKYAAFSDQHGPLT